MSDLERWNGLLRERLSRRAILKGGALATGGLLAAGLTGCSGASSSQQQAAVATSTPKYGGTLRTRIDLDLTSMDPHLGRSGSDYQYTYAFAETLIAPNPDGTPDWKASLADSLENPNPTTLIFRLKKGIKFQDGTDFNAEAAKFNYDRILNGGADFAVPQGNLQFVSSVDVVDEYTIKLNLKQPSPPLLDSIMYDRSAQMVSPAAVKKYGDAEFARHAVGTGPFNVAEIVSGSQYSFEKNKDYWQKGLPYVDSLVVKAIPDGAVALTALKAGELDIMSAPTAKDTSDIRKSKEFTIVEGNGGHTWINLNNNKPPFNNKTVRQAMAYALDWKAIADGLFFGERRVLNQVTTAGCWGHNPNIKGYPYDVEKSKKMLADAGFAGGFSFSMAAWPDQSSQSLAAAIQEQLGKVGIKVTIDSMQMAELSKNRIQGNYTAAIVATSADYEPDLAIRNNYHSKGAYWGQHCPTDKIEPLLDKATSTYDRKEREPVYQQINQVLADECYDLYGLEASAIHLLTSKVQNYRMFNNVQMRLVDVWLTQ